MKMVSLYDYLGRAAGSALGKQIRTIAYNQNIQVDKRQEEIVDNLYNKPITLYPLSFLQAVLTRTGEILPPYKQEACQQH